MVVLLFVGAPEERLRCLFLVAASLAFDGLYSPHPPPVQPVVPTNPQVVFKTGWNLFCPANYRWVRMPAFVDSRLVPCSR